MPKVAVYDMQGKTVGEVDLKDEIFAVGVNQALLHQAVVTYLANQRQGTADTKVRSEVRGGGRKPWRQKGIGRARHGSIRSPLWVGGGTVFGPTPRDYRKKMTKKARRQALRSALSAKVQSEELLVLDGLNFKDPKTKAMVAVLASLQADRKALIVTADRDEALELSSRNIPGVSTRVAEGLNVYDVLGHDKLLMTKDAVTRVEEVLG